MGLSFTLARIVRRGLFMVMGSTVLCGAPGKWDAHARWRELYRSSPDTERWFMPGEVGHESGAAALPLSERAFLTRALGSLGGEPGKAWADHNRLTPRLDFSHNLSRIFPPSLFDEHPEFFPEEAGQRIRPPSGAGWWQPDLGREDVAAYAAKQADQFFAKNPEAVSFALGVNDGLVFGDSAETTAFTTPVRWFRERPDYSNLVFSFMNRAARDLSPAYADKYLGALAYYWAEQVPDFAVDPRVIPFLTADRSQGYDREFLAEDRALQKKWASSFAKAAEDKTASSHYPPVRLGLYDYLYGSGFLIPRQHPQLLADHLRYTRRLGFTDYYAEVYPNWGLDGAQPWLVAQLLQDPEQSAKGLLAEYYRRYFQESARPMRKFFERCEQQWMHQSGQAYWLKFYRNEAQATLFPPEVCRELRSDLETAAREARSDLVRQRVQQVQAAFEVTERFVTMQYARDRLTRGVLAKSGAVSQVWADLAAFREARQDFVSYTEKLQAAQPLLIAPFKLNDYTKNDPTVAALVWLHQHSRGEDQGSELELSGDESLREWWTALAEPGGEIIRNGSFAGPVQAPRVIAELPFEVALPPEWGSSVEPAERYRSALIGEGGTRRLRLEGNINTAMFQWNALGSARFALASVWIRGKQSPSTSVALNLGWLDARQQYLGVTSIRMPAGDWPDWTEIQLGDFAPPGAVWVGIGLRVDHQQKGDWAEVRDFSLKVK